jgi:hypothetical protein
LKSGEINQVQRLSHSKNHSRNSEKPQYPLNFPFGAAHQWNQRYTILSHELSIQLNRLQLIDDLTQSLARQQSLLQAGIELNEEVHLPLISTLRQAELRASWEQFCLDYNDLVDLNNSLVEALEAQGLEARLSEPNINLHKNTRNRLSSLRKHLLYLQAWQDRVVGYSQTHLSRLEEILEEMKQLRRLSCPLEVSDLELLAKQVEIQSYSPRGFRRLQNQLRELLY